MYKNSKGRSKISFPMSVFACLLFTVISLPGCAKSKTHSDGSDASDVLDTQDEGSTERLSDTGGMEEENDGSLAWDSDTIGRQYPIDASRISQGIRDPLLSLSEPDFTEPLEALAEQHCGYIFTAESVASTGGVDSRAVETRAFNADGHLIAAEIRVPQEQEPMLNDYARYRRLQIAYDDTERPTSVRISALMYGTGSVINFVYHDDGSSSARMITDDITPPSYYPFCESLRFDAHGNLTERAWGCDEQVVVQTRSYDDRQRPLFDETDFFADPDVIVHKPQGWSFPGISDQEQWRIEFFYDDEKNQSSAIWKDRPDGWEANHLGWQLYEEVEQRLVKTYDDSGQLTSVQFDGGNDDTVDEQTTYTYRSGELSSVETDFWVDGIVDIIEIHDRSSNRHRIERRNMITHNDSMYFFQTVPEPWDRTALMDITTMPTIQSQTITDIIYNDEMRIAEIAVEEKVLYTDQRNATSTETQLIPVSATWRETREYADRGYVKSKKVVWQPSDRYLEMIDRDETSDVFTSANHPSERFRYTDNQTTCVLKPLCDTGEVVLPEEMVYLTCDVGVLFPEYHRSTTDALSRPVINSTGSYYAVPPYDAVPGIQNRLRSVFGATAVPPPPMARDILDY